MKNAIIGALLIVLALLGLGARDRGDAQPMIEDTTVHADFPLCVLIRPAPLLRTPRGRADFRLGEPSNDRGDA